MQNHATDHFVLLVTQSLLYEAAARMVTNKAFAQFRTVIPTLAIEIDGH